MSHYPLIVAIAEPQCSQHLTVFLCSGNVSECANQVEHKDGSFSNGRRELENMCLCVELVGIDILCMKFVSNFVDFHRFSYFCWRHICLIDFVLATSQWPFVGGGCVPTHPVPMSSFSLIFGPSLRMVFVVIYEV